MSLYSTVQYRTVQYSTVQYSTVQYSAVQYSTVQYSTVQYSTVQYSTSQLHRTQFSVVGAQLKTSQRGNTRYRVQLAEELHLDQEPDFKCRNYPAHGDYAEVEIYQTMIIPINIYLEIFEML